MQGKAGPPVRSHSPLQRICNTFEDFALRKRSRGGSLGACWRAGFEALAAENRKAWVFAERGIGGGEFAENELRAAVGLDATGVEAGGAKPSGRGRILGGGHGERVARIGAKRGNGNAGVLGKTKRGSHDGRCSKTGSAMPFCGCARDSFTSGRDLPTICLSSCPIHPSEGGTPFVPEGVSFGRGWSGTESSCTGLPG